MWRALVLLPCLLAACGPALIAGTEVPDTPENREIFDLVEVYRQAVEAKDAQTLAGIVSERYFENAASTSKVEDDYGFTELLKKVLPVLQDNIQSVQYKIKVEKITVSGNEAHAYFEYELTFHYTEGGQEGWATGKDKNRLDFVREDGSWKITGGL